MTCFHCDISIDSWSQTDDPFKQHLLASPQCTFVNKTYMSSLEERLGSFHTWAFGIKPLPITMAAAGFFHSNKRTDAVSCFCCTLRLEDWKADDDPIRRHMEAVTQERGRPCAWLDKIVTAPEKVVAPVPKRAAPLWDRRKTPRKCGECRMVFSSGNQFHKHKRAAHPIVAGRNTRTKRKKRMAPVNMIAARAVERPAQQQDLRKGLLLGRYRVTKARE